MKDILTVLLFHTDLNHSSIKSNLLFVAIISAFVHFRTAHSRVEQRHRDTYYSSCDIVPMIKISFEAMKQIFTKILIGQMSNKGKKV